MAYSEEYIAREAARRGVSVKTVRAELRAAQAAGYAVPMPPMASLPKVKLILPDPEDVVLDPEEDAPSSSLKCKVCGKRMPTEAALRGHMKKHG